MNWITNKDPKDNGYYFITIENIDGSRKVRTAYYDSSREFPWVYVDVVAWMPIKEPRPYQVTDNDYANTKHP